MSFEKYHTCSNDKNPAANKYKWNTTPMVGRWRSLCLAFLMMFHLQISSEGSSQYGPVYNSCVSWGCRLSHQHVNLPTQKVNSLTGQVADSEVKAPTTIVNLKQWIQTTKFFTVEVCHSFNKLTVLVGEFTSTSAPCSAGKLIHRQDDFSCRRLGVSARYPWSSADTCTCNHPIQYEKLLMCAQKLTQVSLIYRMEPKT